MESDKMYSLFGKYQKNRSIDGNILKKNRISLLILDERWNKLFDNMVKSHRIKACEKKLKKFTKRQVILNGKQITDIMTKRNNMNQIANLVSKSYKGKKEAAEDILPLEKEIKKINGRAFKIAHELQVLNDLIDKTNIELLEKTINFVYHTLKRNKKRRKKLDRLVNDMDNKLKGIINKRKLITKNNSNVYWCFHNLLGADEVEKLDKIYLN
jgi:hypothetical protein